MTAGSAKSRLAAEVAQHTAVSDYPDGVWHCDLSRADDAETVVERVAVARGLLLQTERPPVAPPDRDRHGPASGNLRRDLVRSLETARLLLVLDGCERVQEPVAELVAEVLASGSDARLLVTSRSRLGVPDEQVVKLDPLPVPGRTDPQPDHAPAVQLLRTAATRAGATVAANDPHLAELARRLDGLPLALELAAPRLTSITPAMLVERLDQSLETLTGPPGAPAHHKTLRATFDWSFELLSPPAGRLLAALSLFRGTWDLDTAEAVAPAVDVAPLDVMGLIAELVDQSLVRVDMPAGGTARYAMLDTIRAYAAEHLHHSGRYGAVADLHARYFLDLAERAVPHRRGPDEPAWVAKILIELDDLRVVHRHLVDTGKARDALRLVLALTDELLLRERLEIERWAIELAELPDLADEPGRADLWGLAANASLAKGRLGEAQERAHAALAVDTATGAPPPWTAHNALATLAATGHADSDRREHLDAMQAASDATGDPLPQALALWNQALVGRDAARPDRVDATGRALQALGDHHDNPTMRSMGLLARGRAAVLRNDAETARELLRQARGAAETAGTTLVVNTTVRALADLDADTSDRAASLDALRRAAESFQQPGNLSDQHQTVLAMVEQLVALDALTPAALALGALSRTPTAASVTYTALTALVTERLDPTERLAAQTEGTGMQLTDLSERILRVVDTLAAAGPADGPRSGYPPTGGDPAPT